MEIETINIDEIKPYENNPRKNDRAVDIVAKSIQEFGFQVPVILDKDNVIIAGHTRIKAALKLGIKDVPIIYAEGLSDQQIKAFRIMDNKSQEYADWDNDLLKQEFNELNQMGFDLDLTGFDKQFRDTFFNSEGDEDFSTERGNTQKELFSRTIFLSEPECKVFDDFVKGSARSGEKIIEAINGTKT